jgi:8-oxo-dGTP pyrophosphatase MutT (NUDIX family)
MSSVQPNVNIVELDAARITIEPWSWTFALDRRGDIERHFAGFQRQRPGVWNGRVLLLHRCAIAGRTLHGACFETDYASFISWRDWSFPDPSVFNFFAVAALRGADGAYVVGEMAPYTAAAGWVYFPCGTPEPADIDATGAFDLDSNLRRELLEETGIAIEEVTADPGWQFVSDRGFIAMMKRLTARLSADELRLRIMRHLARDPRPEFTDVRIVRGLADIEPSMPYFVRAFLEKEWQP